MTTVKGSYRGVGKIVRRYWGLYGGGSALVRSPYFHLSVLLALLSYDVWANGPWWTDSISVLPNLLGFTLGGFAIFLSFGDEKFKKIIAGRDAAEGNSASPFLVISSTFMHFVMVQLVALLWALLAKALHFDLPWPEMRPISEALSWVGGAIGYWLFYYGICLAGSAGFAIFRVAGMFDDFSTREREKNAAG